MRTIIDTFIGLVFFCVIFVVVGAARERQHTRPEHTGMSNLPLCTTKTTPSFLCDRVTNTSPAYECVLCVNPSARRCLSSTAVYCVGSCDVAECVPRK